MTKRELFEWLEPFNDDCEVTIEIGSFGIERPIRGVSYKWPKGESSAHVALVTKDKVE